MNVSLCFLTLTVIFTLSTTMISFSFQVVLNFGVNFRSLNGSLPSPSSLLSRTGHNNVLNLGQNLVIDGIVYGSLDLRINAVHHLVHFSGYSRVQFAQQLIDLVLRIYACWILAIIGANPNSKISMIRMRTCPFIFQVITSNTFLSPNRSAIKAVIPFRPDKVILA